MKLRKKAHCLQVSGNPCNRSQLELVRLRCSLSRMTAPGLPAQIKLNGCNHYGATYVYIKLLGTETSRAIESEVKQLIRIFAS